jgi:2-polyprenyl-3-methyl-5-hydroxy-6-metoxy-1,4-benzoquinol methylase
MNSEEKIEKVRADSQSIAYGSDIAQVLQQEYPLGDERYVSMLDVGPRTATGTNVIAQLFHPLSWSRLKVNVVAMDIDPLFAAQAREAFPDIRYEVDDIFKHEQKYDIVVCSHTIEHVEDPGAFFKRLTYLAKELVILAAPYKEPEHNRIPGHINTIGDEFFKQFTPNRLQIYKSPHWHNGDCFIAVYRIAGN